MARDTPERTVHEVPADVSLTLDAAVLLDSRDPLASFQRRYVVPDRDLVYLDGNSLGRLPQSTRERLRRVVDEEWGDRLIRSWHEEWLALPQRVGDLIGTKVLGAAAGQTIVADSTTVWFYKLLFAAAEARPGRDELVTDSGNFPTDRYVVDSVARRLGLQIRWLSCDPVAGPSLKDVEPLVGPRTAVLALSHIDYRSAAIADMAAIGACVHEAGALTLWDLSHSAGAVALRLDEAEVDLAVGCTYKFLNGGPGAPAYAYVARAQQDVVHQPIWGWMGHRDPFAMTTEHAAAKGVRSMLSGTPPVLGLAAVEEGVRIVAEAGVDAIHEKGRALTSYAINLFDAWLAPRGFALASPRDATRRGAHVSVRHPRAKQLTAALIDDGVVPDYRKPDLVRLGMAPLTTRFVDVWHGLDALRRLTA